MEQSVRIVDGPSHVGKRISRNDSDSGTLIIQDDSLEHSPEELSIDLEEHGSKKQEQKIIDDDAELLKGDMEDGQKYVEKFNQEIMDQFLEYQRRYSSSYVKWERERYTILTFLVNSVEPWFSDSGPIIWKLLTLPK